MPRCLHCQYENPDFAEVCGLCGKVLRRASAPPRPAHPAQPSAPLPVPPGETERGQAAYPTPTPDFPPSRGEMFPPQQSSSIPAAYPAVSPELRPAGVRQLAFLYFAISLLCALILLASAEFRGQVAHPLQRMPGLNGPFLLFLSLLTLLAGFGLRKYWSGGWNLALLTCVVGIISGGLAIYGGGAAIPYGVLILASLAVIYYLFRPHVVHCFRGGPEFTTTEYERVEIDPSLLGAILQPRRHRRYEYHEIGKRQHDLLNYLGFLLVIAYGVARLASLIAGGLGPILDYTDEDYRFRISAPPGWVVADIAQTGAVVSLVKPDPSGSIVNQPAVSVFVGQARGASAELEPDELAAWEQEWVRLSGQAQFPARLPTTLDGVDGWKMELQRERGNVTEHWLLVVAKRAGRIYTLRGACMDPFFSETLPEFEKVLAQFKFLP